MSDMTDHNASAAHAAVRQAPADRLLNSMFAMLIVIEETLLDRKLRRPAHSRAGLRMPLVCYCGSSNTYSMLLGT